MTKAWIYCRLDKPSTHTQEMEQLKLRLLNYANNKGYEVVGTTEEFGSGRICDRRDLNEILEQAQNEKFDILVSERGDHIARELSEYYKFSSKLKERGARMEHITGLDIFGKDIEVFDDAPEPAKRKPDCELIGQDGNIFNLIGIAQRTLKRNGMGDEAKEMFERINAEAKDYSHALCIIGEYVNITGPGEEAGMEEMSL
ncbi:MAG: recombinase family protein [Oscillospiraceae bacterium]|nr:recombinase family protein [Oscillospiraceae bacterium]